MKRWGFAFTGAAIIVGAMLAMFMLAQNTVLKSAELQCLDNGGEWADTERTCYKPS